MARNLVTRAASCVSAAVIRCRWAGFNVATFTVSMLAAHASSCDASFSPRVTIRPGASCSGCVYTDNTVTCSDGSACTTGDTCAEGLRVGGVALDCDDKNVCTSDSCNKDKGCVHMVLSAPCSDGNACTAKDQCASDQCVSGAALNCDDGSVCTLDTCDTSQGCVHLATALTCTDGDACTVGDTCVKGLCTSGAAPECFDGLVCTIDTCSDKTGCVHQPKTGACDDGQACTVGSTCSGTACVGGKPRLGKWQLAGVSKLGVSVHRDMIMAFGSFGNSATGNTIVVYSGQGLKLWSLNDSLLQGISVRGGMANSVGGTFMLGDGNKAALVRVGWDGAIAQRVSFDSFGIYAVGWDDGLPVVADRVNTIARMDIFGHTSCTEAGDCAGDSGCDDSDPCTADSCTAAKGCAHVAHADGTVCATGKTCKLANCQ